MGLNVCVVMFIARRFALHVPLFIVQECVGCLYAQCVFIEFNRNLSTVTLNIVRTRCM